MFTAQCFLGDVTWPDATWGGFHHTSQVVRVTLHLLEAAAFHNVYQRAPVSVSENGRAIP